MQEKPEKSLTVGPIGRVERRNGSTFLEIAPQFAPALEKLEEFSHVMVIWWADRPGNIDKRSVLTTELPYAPGVQAGVFACRAEYRPNPIALTTCPIESIDVTNGTVRVSNIDAENGTPVLDLKPYIPVCDRVNQFRQASWFKDWPEWLPETGLELQH